MKIIKSNNKIIECTEYVQSHRPCNTSDTIASHYDHKAEHQSQYATLNQMRRGIAVPQMQQSHLPDNHTTQNYPTEYDLKWHTDFGAPLYNHSAMQLCLMYCKDDATVRTQ